MTFDQLVLSIHLGSSVKPLLPAIESNMTFTSRGSCTSAQTPLSLVAHPLFACLSSMNIFFVGGVKLLHSVLSWCAPTELFSEGKTPSRELEYTPAVKLQSRMWGSQVKPEEPQVWAVRCNSREALCCSHRSRFSTIINQRWC